MTIGAQIPCFDPALVALLWEIKGVQKTTKEIKSYSRKLLIFSKESKKCKFLVVSQFDCGNLLTASESILANFHLSRSLQA
jgi:hypothetical protein